MSNDFIKRMQQSINEIELGPLAHAKSTRENEVTEKDELERLRKIAEQTGEKQKAGSWMEPCNDEDEECNWDIVTKYIDKEGKCTLSRQHTW